MPHREPEYRRRRRKEAEENQRYADREWDEATENTQVEKIVIAVEGIIQKLESAEDKKSPKNKDERRWKRREVCGLWAAAAVGLIAIVVGNVDAHRQRDTMQAQLDEMRDEQRPWVYVEGVPEIYYGIEIFPQQGARINLRFFLQNSGHIPALETRIALRFINNANGWPLDQDGEQRLACNTIGHKDTYTSGAVTAFPGRAHEVDTYVLMDWRQVEIAATGTMPPNWQYSRNAPGNLSPFIVGCVQYRFTSGGSWHVTPIDYYVTYVVSPDQGDARITIPFSDTRMTIPAARLRVLKNGGTSAVPPT